MSIDTTRANVALLALYLGKAETRDKVCRAIQYGSKLISGGEKGTAQDVEKSTSLARKVFRLLKSVNEIENLLTPVPKSTPLAIALLLRARSALLATFFGLDQIVWLGRSGIYKNKETTDLCSRISLYSWMWASITGSVVEAAEIMRLFGTLKKLDYKIRKAENDKDSLEESNLVEAKSEQLSKLHSRSLNYVKNSLDILVGIGLLQLAPRHVNARVTGALGLITSLIACYQLFPATSKGKNKTA